MPIYDNPKTSRAEYSRRHRARKKLKPLCEECYDLATAAAEIGRQMEAKP